MADLSKETLQRLDEAATPGPWAKGSSGNWFVDNDDVGNHVSVGLLADGDPIMIAFSQYHDDEPDFQKNAELVALLRNSVPAILKLLDEHAEMREACLAYCKAFDEGTGTVYVNDQIRTALANQENTHG